MMGLVFITADKDRFTHTICDHACITPVELANGDWWITEETYLENKEIIDRHANEGTHYTKRNVLDEEYKQSPI